MTEILGVRVDSIAPPELENRLRSFLQSDRLHKVFTPNAEMLLAARQNPGFQECLNRGDLNLPDGVSLIFADRFLNTKRSQSKLFRATGVDTLGLICRLAAEEGKRVMLYGADPGVAEKAAESIQKSYPHLVIKGLDPGVIKNEEANVGPINEFEPDVLAVALGHGKQEHFICSMEGKVPSLKIAIGVGGALDYLSGNVPRAPRLMQQRGLEWLFRLIQQPKRIGRIFNAVVVFPFIVIQARIKAL